MPIRVRRKAADTYQHGDLREALIQAGLKLLTDGGVSNLGLRAAAQLAGVSHTAPYRHFKDKNDLVDAIGERGFRMLTARMREEIARVPSAGVPDRLSAAGVGYVSFALQNPGYFRVIFSGLIGGGAMSPALHAAGEEAYGVLRALVTEGIAGEALVKEDADTLSLCAWSLVHGLGMLAVDGKLAAWGEGQRLSDVVTRKLLALLQSGITRPGVRPGKARRHRRAS